jgi:phosphopantetheinyl transferase
MDNLEYHEKIDFFYDSWTKKEAIIKAIGIGLSYPINNFDTLSLTSEDGILLNDGISSQILYLYLI